MMYRKKVNESSPMRILERSIHVGASGGQVLKGLGVIAVRRDAPDAGELPFGGGYAFPDFRIVSEAEPIEQSLALIDQIEDGGFDDDETIIFLHTGGLPAVFTFADQLANFKGKV